ncbi:MAG: hypothetical protein H6P99_1819 [Holophagaceae bacterium]|nr:hypothetical protein [Holophagaceae bacterium]
MKPGLGDDDKTEVKPNRRRRGATGPRTPAGKVTSSQNALRHGAYSEALGLLLESPEDYRKLREGLLSTLHPLGHLEESLVDRLASLWWRMNRAKLAANQSLWMAGRRNMEDPFLVLGGGMGVMEQAVALDADECRIGGAWSHDSQERLLRHEMTLERAFFRILHELERLQARRHGQLGPPPVTVDLNLNQGAD